MQNNLDFQVPSQKFISIGFLVFFSSNSFPSLSFVFLWLSFVFLKSQFCAQLSFVCAHFNVFCVGMHPVTF